MESSIIKSIGYKHIYNKDSDYISLDDLMQPPIEYGNILRVYNSSNWRWHTLKTTLIYLRNSISSYVQRMITTSEQVGNEFVLFYFCFLTLLTTHIHAYSQKTEDTFPNVEQRTVEYWQKPPEHFWSHENSLRFTTRQPHINYCDVHASKRRLDGRVWLSLRRIEIKYEHSQISTCWFFWSEDCPVFLQWF